jgi:hypothetical protein
MVDRASEGRGLRERPCSRCTSKLPILVLYQPGQGYDDVVVLAFVLAAVALLVNGALAHTPTAVAGLAAGFGLGTKLTMVAPTAALTPGVIAAAPRGERRRTALFWTAPLLVVSGFWYLRNLLHVGNPLPVLDLHVGPLSLPSPPLPRTFLVAECLTDSGGGATSSYRASTGQETASERLLGFGAGPPWERRRRGLSGMGPGSKRRPVGVVVTMSRPPPGRARPGGVAPRAKADERC